MHAARIANCNSYATDFKIAVARRATVIDVTSAGMMCMLG